MGLFDKFRKKISEGVGAVKEAAREAVRETSEVFRFNKVKDGLEKTRTQISSAMQNVLRSGRKIDAQMLDEIEEILITADIGVDTSEKIINNLKIRVKEEKVEDAPEIYELLKEEVLKLLIKSPSAENDATYSIDEGKKPHTILIIGVNGVGKTTTIGKLAYNYKQNGKEVIIGAADTFRAAANEQLEVWAQRADVQIIQREQGSDPGAVVYDTVNTAIKENKDVVIVDTAGRLHNKGNLMKELEKLSRVMKKLKDDAPDDVYLVLDGTTGQNAISQAKEFMKVANITGIVLTKLDGTAKGGVVIPIAEQLQIPVRYIGVGEKINDLQVFEPAAFVEALFGTVKKVETEENDQ